MRPPRPAPAVAVGVPLLHDERHVAVQAEIGRQHQPGALFERDDGLDRLAPHRLEARIIEEEMDRVTVGSALACAIAQQTFGNGL